MIEDSTTSILIFNIKSSDRMGWSQIYQRPLKVNKYGAWTHDIDSMSRSIAHWRGLIVAEHATNVEVFDPIAVVTTLRIMSLHENKPKSYKMASWLATDNTGGIRLFSLESLWQVQESGPVLSFC